MKHNFGIIGMGFLGNAIVHGFGLHANIKIYDKFKDYDKLEDVVDSSQIFWLCLPTPMKKETGEIDLSILEENLQYINSRVKASENKIAIIKSTVVPGTTKEFAKKYTNLKFVMNPEFLTARNNKLDFICASRIVIGADDFDAGQVIKKAYENRFGNSIPIYVTDTVTAETVKYGANLFFAVKISYFNYINSVCEKLGINYDEVKDLVLADGRIARSHADVPGWDGNFGYGGACFPKDINAFINFSKQIGIDPLLLESSWEQNLNDRRMKDWESIPGVISNANSEVV